jgi:subtilisin family serine protease
MCRASRTSRGIAAAVWIALLAMTAPLRAEESCEPFPADAATVAPPSTSASGAAEVLLMLPKRADGTVDTDGLELAPGARIASSYFSPLICATLSVVVGPPGTPASELVRGLPDDALVVENSVYEGAADLPSEGVAVPGSGPDPYRPLQYALDWIDVDASRSVTDGTGARIAILDSLPDVAHPDLPGVRVVRPTELPQTGVGSHGTLIAGIAGAAVDNGFGIAGVAPGAELLAIPVCRPPSDPGESDRCLLFDVLVGIDAAFTAEAQVVNLSLVGPPNPLLERAMARLDGLGIVAVAAAGNEGSDAPRYPAAYPTVIGVNALDQDGAPFTANNRGSHVEIAAPGVEIISTIPGGGFAFSDGTSLATAHVSAVLGLLIAAEPDVVRARRALFEAGHRNRRATRDYAALPEVCSALALLGKPCPDR